MGQTLTNGIFLPNEGERNCYNGLEGNWRAIDGYIGNYNVHVADVVIHVSQEDRNKWDAVTGKADSSALTAHTGNTTIHVTAANKTKWDTVTSKANDSDVVHKAGAETVAGPKTFTDTVTVPSINGLNPGGLSMPNLSAGVDISGYFTIGTTENTYTPTVNGWVSIHAVSSTNATVSVENSKGFYDCSSYVIPYTGTDRHSNLCFPVIAGETYNITLKSVNTSIAAKFFPCIGNV